MDDKILEFYELLGISTDGKPLDASYAYESNIPYEKCSVIVDVPNTISNSITLR